MWVNRDFEPIPPDTDTLIKRPGYTGGMSAGTSAHSEAGGGVDTERLPFALLRSGQIAHWEGARERGETGLVALAGVAAFALYEVPAVPDFSSSRFPDLSKLGSAAERCAQVAEQQAQLLAALHALGPGIGVSLRYLLCQPVRSSSTPQDVEVRIRCFFVLRALRESEEEARALLSRAEQTLAQSLPYGYPLLRRRSSTPEEEEESLTGSVLFPANVSSICEILKTEQVAGAWHEKDLTGFSFWYHPVPFSPAAGNDMIGFCRSLTTEAAGNALIDITLVPAPPLTTVERHELAAWGQLAEKWSRDQKVQLPGGLYSRGQTLEVAADPQAGEVKKALSDQLSRYGSPQSRLYLYAVRVLGPGPAAAGFAGDTADPRSLATALATRALSPGSATQLVRLTPEHPAFERAVRSVHFSYVTPAVCNEALWQRPEAPETLRRLHRLATHAEIASFFRLPIPGHDGCPGMPLDAGLPGMSPKTAGAVDRQAASAVPAAELRIGSFASGTRITSEAATIPLADLAKHCLIVGTPGSGKTSLSFSLLTQLWREQNVPFLVFEPAKTEYRALATVPGLAEDLLVFTVGSERVSPFRLNPLEVLPGVPVAEHIAALTTCFQGAFSLPDPLPMLLDEAIREVYADKGWSEYDAGGDNPDLAPPTLYDLSVKAGEVAARSRYQGEIAGNIRAALETRLGALLRGPKGRCFGARHSIPVDLLMARPVVLELESLTDEEKALFMMLLLVFLREQVRATRRSGSSKLAHVVLVEEAHNLLGAGDAAHSRPSGQSSSGDPKGVAVRYFTRMLAEMRALGEGIVIADQLPTALAPEAVKNTNVKVMHRLTAADDREVLGRTMVLDAAQLEQAATLPPGQSFVFQEGWPRARHVVEPDFKAEYGVEVPPDDIEVRERMQPFTESSESVKAAFLPFAACGAVCQRCDSRVREETERWTARKLPVIEAEQAKRCPAEKPEVVAITEFLSGFDPPQEDRIRWHCASVHFAERCSNSSGGKQ